MKSLQCLGRIDVGALEAAVVRHAADFGLATFRQSWPGTPHSDTETLYLRMPAAITVESIFESLDCQDGPLMHEPAFADAVAAVSGLVGGEPARAMIVRLRAGGRVARHTDQGAYADATRRFHLSVTTNAQCLMRVGSETAHAEPGEVYFFDKHAPHEVVNEGDTDRIHLILDIWQRKTTKITYQEESFSAVRNEIAGLIVEHWSEVADNPDIPVDVDWDYAAKADDLGLLRVLTVRSDGVLVGYIIFLLATLPHYRTVLSAADDAFFLKKEHRNGMVGVRMFREAEKMLVECGVRRVVYHEKTKVPIGKVFKFLGYRPIETIWSKELAPPATNVRVMIKRQAQMRPRPLRRIPIV